MRNKGFTLIELMVVISIIGILAAIAIPSYTDYINRAKVSEALSMIGPLKSEISDFYKDKGRFPVDNAELNVAQPEKFIGNYVSSIRVENGALHIQFGNKINKQLKGKIISIRPIYVADNHLLPVSWLCGSNPLVEGMDISGDNKANVPASYLVSSCR